MRGSPSRRRETAPELHHKGKQLGSMFRRKSSTTTTENSAVKRTTLFRRTVKGVARDEPDLEHPPERIEQETEDLKVGSDRNTSVLASYDTEGQKQDLQQSESLDAPLVDQSACSAIAALQHSFLFCAAGYDDDDDDDKDKLSPRKITRLPEDPTVQESIECVFASQLEQGLPIDTLWESPAEPKEIMPPAMLLQTRTSSRLGTVTSTQFRKPKTTFRTGSLVHMGTYDAVTGIMAESPPKIKKKIDTAEPTTLPTVAGCSCATGRKTPLLSPAEWPQYPLMFCVGSGTTVKGIRFSAQQDYLWKVGDSHTWIDALHSHWGRSSKNGLLDLGCPMCMTLPINNGNEPEGEALVVDFESDAWIGTILLRLRFTEGTTVNKYDDSTGYFAGMNRRYQAVVTGSPKQAIPISQCVTGLQLERKATKLPARWIMKGAIKLLHFFAPQLDCNLDNDRPYSLTPLGSTPQMFGVNCLETVGDIERKQEEPTEPQHTLVGQASTASTSLARSKFRKKALDKLFLQEASHPQLTPEHEYTMEFLQHLFSFQTFEMELGALVGNYQLKDLLNGQPLQLMAMDKTTKSKLWSFDIWHECLVEDSLRND